MGIGRLSSANLCGKSLSLLTKSKFETLITNQHTGLRNIYNRIREWKYCMSWDTRCRSQSFFILFLLFYYTEIAKYLYYRKVKKLCHLMLFLHSILFTSVTNVCFSLVFDFVIFEERISCNLLPLSCNKQQFPAVYLSRYLLYGVLCWRVSSGSVCRFFSQVCIKNVIAKDCLRSNIKWRIHTSVIYKEIYQKIKIVI